MHGRKVIIDCIHNLLRSQGEDEYPVAFQPGMQTQGFRIKSILGPPLTYRCRYMQAGRLDQRGSRGCGVW